MRKRCDGSAVDEEFFEHSPAAPVGGKAAVLLTGMRTKASWFLSLRITLGSGGIQYGQQRTGMVK